MFEMLKLSLECYTIQDQELAMLSMIVAMSSHSMI